MVTYYENYGPYVQLAKTGYQEIESTSLTPDNYMSHFNGILNIMKDGIEQPDVQAYMIGVQFPHDDLLGLNRSDEFVKFTLVDYWYNLLFWTFPICAGNVITVRYIFDTRAITKGAIVSFFNKLIKSYRKDMNFMLLNNLLDDSISKMKEIDTFALYLANTVNFKDTINLMEKYPEFNASMHADLSDTPIEDVKSIGMDYTNMQIRYIKDNDHCLRDSFVSGEAISPKQFKEVSVNVGTKPDGQGRIFPYIINNSFMNGGVANPESYVIDSSVGRIAQILQKMNVGTSGAFARLLETNNLDTFLNDDPNYTCNTANFIEITIKDAKFLRLYDKRYYKINPHGVDYLLDADRDTHLIGKTLYFRSPITCQSYARGTGICHKCYGDLYYTNRDINPGKLAAELLSEKYTQMLLSAKHLLESAVVEMKWNPEFFDIFNIELNTINIDEDTDVSGFFMILDSSKFDSDDDDDSDGIIYEEFTPSFDIRYPDGHVVTFHTVDEDNIYLTEDLNRVLKSKKSKEDDGIYTIPLDAVKSLPSIFTVKIQNKELQRTLERSKHIIDREKDTSSFNKNTIVSEFINANLEGGLVISAVHLEVLLSNQMRDPDNILEMPNWAIENAPYKILTLSSALNYSPSITVNFEYQRVGKTLVSPLSTKKHKPSIFDLYFMEKPQDFMVNTEMVSDKFHEKDEYDMKGNKDAIYFVTPDKGSKD